MRVPLSWLRELVEVDVPVAVLAERLALSGTSVESVATVGGDVAGVVVARVGDVHDVPEARKPMWRADVDAGDHGTFEVVAGAPIAVGDVVPFAKPGSRVTTIPELGTRKMLGKYTSQGMLCSAYELGLGDDHSGILKLDPDTPLGADVAELLNLDDVVLELEITPNRPDLLSMVGVARELSVLYDVPLRMPSFDVAEDGDDTGSSTSVEVEDAEGCPRYLARVITGVRFGPSPATVRARLHACGLRPLGNLVDATNYVLELTGQPLHAFDLSKLAGGRIVVRRARPGEVLTTLDDVERKLEPSDLVIADAEHAQALAGIMGGAASEVGPDTETVLLESAYFEPRGIYRTARRLMMSTGASQRFEKGADPDMVPEAAALCAELMRRWAGGTVARRPVDVGAAPQRESVHLRRARADLVIGASVPDEEQDRILTGLGCALVATGDTVEVTPPSWRPDLTREIDLIEEVARIHGYDDIPMRVPHGQRGFLTTAQSLRRRVRDVLLGAGLSEATLSSFLSDDDLRSVDGAGTLEITNPLTTEQGHLRPSLVPGLLRAAQRNLARGVGRVRLFEIGTVFGAWSSDSDLPKEAEHVAAVLAGPAEPLRWDTTERGVDAYDAKGVVELLLSEIGIGEATFDGCDALPFHPGRSATVVIDGHAVGRFGELRPSVARDHDVDGGGAVLELDLGALFARVPDALAVRPIPQLPPVLRDVNLVVGEDVPAADVRSLISEAGGEDLESATLIDVYRGEPVPVGRKSLVWRLTFRASDRTLTAEEADAAREAIVTAARERLRADVR